MAKKLIVLGATGAVGSALLRQCLADERVLQVISIARRPVQNTAEKLINVLLDSEGFACAQLPWQADAVLCCIGTTRRNAGSAEAFAAIDHGLVLQAARAAREAGVDCFVYNSSLGASAQAPTHYFRVKAKVESDLKALGFASLGIVRPGMLDAPERTPARFGERSAIAVLKTLAPMLPASWRPIHVDGVAAKMLMLALQATPGVQLLSSAQMQPER